MAQFRLGRPSFEDDEEDGGEYSPLFKTAGEAYRNDVLPAAKPAPSVPVAPAQTKGSFSFDLYGDNGAAAPRPQKEGGFTFDLYAGQEKPKPAQEKKEDAGFFSVLGRGAKSGGWDSAKETGVGAVALVADTLGAKDTANEFFGKFQELKKEAEAESRPYESFSNVMEGKASLGDFLTHWSGYAIGQAAQTVVAAVAGAAVGSAVGSPGAGTAAGAIAGVLERGAVQTGVKAWVAKKLEEQVAANVAREAAKGTAIAQAEKMAYEAAAKTVFRTLGAAAAVSANNLAMEGASIYGEARELAESKGEETNLGRVWTAAVLAAGTDTAMDLVGLKGFAKAAGGGNIIKNIAIESFKGGLREGVTEGIQTGFERWGAGKDLATADAIRDYIDSAAAGAVGGVLFGAAKGTKKSAVKEDRKYTLDEVRSMFEQKMSNPDGRQEIFDTFSQDPRVAAALKASNIESPDDPRFDKVMATAIARSEQLTKLEPPTAEEQQKRTQERGEDVRAAFGDTASTGTGVNTGATEPVLQRESVVPNPETKTLEPVGDAPTPVVLPEGKTTPAGTVAMAPEDIVSRQQGFEVQPAFNVGASVVANRFVSSQQAETFLFGPINKETGKREGGYASSVEDMEFQVRQGKRSKDAGGGVFYFVEGREKVPGAPAAAAPAPTSAPTSAPTPAPAPAPKPAPAPAPAPVTAPAPAPVVAEKKEEPFKFSEDPYTAGTEAATRKMAPSANPFKEGTPESAKFAQGFLDTAYPETKADESAKIDEAANQAATSPTSPTPPTDAQKEAGNYKKGHVKVVGLDIAVENPRGSERSGTDASGKAWRQNMAHHYGYVKGSKGADKDHVDVFLGPNPASSKVFVVDQVNPDGTFDEHKALLGFDTVEEAEAGYRANYGPDWKGMGAISEMPVDAFKSWVKDGQKKKPLAYAQPQQTKPAAEQTQQTKQTAPVAETPAPPAKESTLWRFDKVTGYWKSERKVTEETKDQWLSQFQKDSPDETFVVSDRKPSKPPAKKTVEQKVKEKAAAKKEQKPQAEKPAEQPKPVEAEKPAEPKQTVEQKVKTKQKAKKEAKAEEPKTASEQEAFERWEEDDDGETHIAWKDLPKDVKDDVRAAVGGGYYNTPLHDEVVERIKKNERTERVNKKAAENAAAKRKEGIDGSSIFRTSGGGGMPLAKVESTVQRVSNNWANAPVITVVQDESGLPERTQQEIKEQKIEGKVSGVYVNGQVYIVADNCSNEKEVILTVVHESAGHYGLRSILGSSYSKVMNDIYQGNESIRRDADKAIADEGLSREVAVEEALTDILEKQARAAIEGRAMPKEQASIIQKVVAAVRKFLRETLGVAYVSDKEVLQIIENARRYVVQGDVKAGIGEAALTGASREQKSTFYSAMARSVASAKQENAPAKDWKAIISKLPGVKQEEIDWTGVNQWLDGKGSEKVSKQQLLDFIAGNKLRLNDILLFGRGRFLSDSELRAMYEEAYPDGDMPADPAFMDRDELLNELGLESKEPGTKHNNSMLTLKGGKEYVELVLTEPSKRTYPYARTDDIHFGDVSGGKAIGWLRMNVRQDAAGNPVLFLEELQSKRAQDGRKQGFFEPEAHDKELRRYDAKIKDLKEQISDITSKMKALNDSQLDEFNSLADERQKLNDELSKAGEEEAVLLDKGSSAVPSAPFVENTKSWTALLLKRAIAYAQENGIDRIAWTTGEQQNERYKFPGDELVYVKDKKTNTVTLTIMQGAREIKTVPDIPASKLGEFVGERAAERINSNEGIELDNEIEQSGSLKGDDLKLMAANLTPYYNQTVPSVSKDVISKYGGKVEIMEIDGTGQQLGFVIPEKMRQVVAEDGLPLFRRKDYEKQYGDLDAKTREIALAKGHYSPPTIRERLEALKPDMWRRVVQGMFDKTRSIRDVDEKAHMMARISQGAAEAGTEGLLHYGQVFNDGGALNIKKGTKGLLEILKPVGGEVDRFLLWIAANRAEQLKKDDRERFFSDDEIARLKRLNLGSMGGKSRPAVYAETLRQMNELNRSVLDVARQTGLIDESAYKRFSSDIWYVPFYRVMEGDGTLSAANASTSSALVGQYLSKKLKGSERQLNDLMQNVLMNWSHILSASMKNGAANETLNAAVKMGAVTELKAQQKGAVKTMVNGKETFWSVEDPLLLQSLESLSALPSNSFWLDIARTFKTTLTRFVSLSPTFKINNLVRDSVQSIGVTDLKPNPITNVIQGWRAYKDNRAEALVGGGLFTLGNAFDGDKTAQVKRLINMGVAEADILTTPEKAKAWASKVWEKYDQISDAAENANRLALYEQLRAKGATHLEASYAARDLQDFSNQGAWTIVRYASQVLPYFNARLQGLYKLGRGGMENPQRFGAVLGAVTMFGLVLYLSQKDDDDWKKREDWDRDAFFWIKVPGTKYAARIPKPFEMGAFSTIVERFTEQIVDKDVEGKVFGKRLLAVLHDNLAINPIPQVVRPLYDLARNKDGFTDRPIESMGMERLSPGERINPGTSAAAVSIGKLNAMFADFAEKASGGAITANNAKLSPIQYDYLLRNYLGWLGTVIQTTSDVAARPFKDGQTPAMKVDDILVVGNFVKSMPQSQSRYVTSFYESAREIAMATADYKAAFMANEDAKAARLMESKGDLIALNKIYSKAQRMMSTVSKEIKRVQEDKEMSGEQKRIEMDRLSAVRIEIAKDVETMRLAFKRK